MLNIVSNGSKWAGEARDSVEDLLRVLEKEPLDRRFEKLCEGGFVRDQSEGVFKFMGNFARYSHVFHIVTDEPEVIKKLTRAIKTNMKRADYRSQPKLKH